MLAQQHPRPHTAALALALALLRSLALVNKKVNLLVQRPSLWKHAYESSYALSDDKLSEWGAEAMPDFLWKACVIRSAAPWPAAA